MSSSLTARFATFVASNPRIILGTASASRRAIMDSLAEKYAFKYDVIKADIDEKAIRHDAPRDLVLALAHAKADAILQQLAPSHSSSSSSSSSAVVSAAAAAGTGFPAATGSSSSSSSSSAGGTFLITCDQVVVHAGQLREKPEDVAEAHRFIHSYSKSPAQTVGSVLCTNVQTGSRHEMVEVCTIHMTDMPDDVIDQLIAEGDVMWCAGGLMVEHPLVTPYITQIEGTQESVMGLGKEAVMQVLVEAAGM